MEITANKIQSLKIGAFENKVQPSHDVKNETSITPKNEDNESLSLSSISKDIISQDEPRAMPFSKFIRLASNPTVRVGKEALSKKEKATVDKLSKLNDAQLNEKEKVLSKEFDRLPEFKKSFMRFIDNPELQLYARARRN